MIWIRDYAKALLFYGLIAALSASPVRALAQEGYLEQELKELSAATPSPTPLQAAPNDFSFFNTAATMFVVLLLIIGLIVLLGFVLKTFLKGKRFGSGKIATVLSVTHVVDKKYVAAVEVLGRTLILGIGADSVNLLADLGVAFVSEGEEAGASGVDASTSAEEFSNVLAERVSTMEEGEATSFLETLTDQVKKRAERLKR